MPRKAKKEALNFEESLVELESLVDHLENGELSLEESLKSFERGIELFRSCRKALDEAEQKVRILVEPAAAGGDPQAQLEDFKHDE